MILVAKAVTLTLRVEDRQEEARSNLNRYRQSLSLHDEIGIVDEPQMFPELASE